MKRFLVVLTIICSLSLPVLGGHQQMGGGAYCPCEPVQNVCPCCGGDMLTVAQENDSTSQDASDGAELRTIRMAFMIWLKLKA